MRVINVHFLSIGYPASSSGYIKIKVKGRGDFMKTAWHLEIISTSAPVLETSMHQVTSIAPQLLLAIPFMAGFILYFLAIFLSRQKGRNWPVHRTIFWVFGTFFAVAAVAGPVANRAHTDFTYHMAGHLLLGMLAPLLMALAAPMTLLVRSLSVTSARKVSRLLRSQPVRILSDPITASILNIGGLWLLYTTNLFHAMYESVILYLIIHLHVFLAGYLFTTSIIYIDPIAHRTSYVYRSIVLVLALAGHGILAKYLYAHPLDGIPVSQAETGGMFMYYGGDAIDLMLIIILFFHWYKSTSPKISSYAAQ